VFRPPRRLTAMLFSMRQQKLDILCRDIPYFVPGWPNIAGDVSPVASMAMGPTNHVGVHVVATRHMTECSSAYLLLILVTCCWVAESRRRAEQETGKPRGTASQSPSVTWRGVGQRTKDAASMWPVPSPSPCIAAQAASNDRVYWYWQQCKV